MKVERGFHSMFMYKVYLTILKILMYLIVFFYKILVCYNQHNNKLILAVSLILLLKTRQSLIIL